MNSWYPSRVMPTNGDFIQRHAEAVAIHSEVTAIHIISDKSCTPVIDLTDEIINGVRTHIGYIKYTKNPLLKYVRFIKAFRKVSKKLDPFHVVHLNRIYPLGVFALYLKYVKRIPFIISEHWTGFLKNNAHALSFSEKTLSKIIIKNASFTCTVSQNLADSMLELGLNGNYRVIPNVVNTNVFKPNKIKDRQFIILHISNMIDAHKNINSLLAVIAELKKEITNFKLIMIGNGSDNYTEQIQKLSIQDCIEIIPQIEHHKIVSFMQSADVFALFSNYENLPCVILESFSCGLPVIATDVGGISEFFPDDFGYLTPKGDTDKLLETFIHFYQNKQVYDVSKMHQYVKDNFGPLVISKAFLKCYLAAID